MSVCVFYVLSAFLPSLPVTRRCANLRVKLPPATAIPEMPRTPSSSARLVFGHVEAGRHGVDNSIWAEGRATQLQLADLQKSRPGRRAADGQLDVTTGVTAVDRRSHCGRARIASYPNRYRYHSVVEGRVDTYNISPLITYPPFTFHDQQA